MSKQKQKAKPGSERASGGVSTSVSLPIGLQKHATTIFLSLLALLLIVFFHEALFSGKVFNVPDNLSAIQYEQGYLQKADQDGVNPFWNPYIFSGMPTWGSSSPGHGMYLHTFLDPLKPMLLLQVYGWLQSLVEILPLPPTFWDIFNYFLLGVFTYFFGLRKKFEPFTAFLVAVSVTFSLYSLNWIMAGHNTKITVFAWLPATLLLIDYLFEKKSVITIAFLVVALHLTFNSGHVQMIFYNMLAAGLFILFKLYQGEKLGNTAIVATIVIVAAAFAFLMLSGPYFATWEYKDFSIRGAGSGGSGHGSTTGGLDYEYATNWSFSPIEIITFVIPSFVGWGTPTYWGTMPFTESPIYLGVVICFLALIGILLRPKDRFVHFWIALGAIALLISMGRNFGVLYDPLFYNLPMFNNFRIPSMILYLNALCVGMLAGVGLSELIQRVRSFSKATEQVEKKKLTKLIWAPVIAGVILVGFLLMLESSLQKAISENLQQYQPQSWNLVQQVEEAAQAGQLSQVPAQYRKATVKGISGMAIDDAIKALAFVVIVAGLLWAFVRRKIGLTAMQSVILIVLVIDWWIVDYKPMHMEPQRVQQQALQKTDAVDFLQKDKSVYRILPVSAHAGDNYYVAYGIQSVAGYHPAKMKYSDDIRNTLFNQFQFQSPQQVDNVNWALLSMLNTKYVVVSADFALTSPWLKRVFEGANEHVYLNEFVLPRAFFVGSYEVIEDDEAMFKKIGTFPGYEADRVAYLSKPLAQALPQVSDSVIARAKATLKSFGINSFEYEVETPVDAILKLSEVYYPSGWKATIDGEEIEILRSDYLLRAVVIPAGKHTLRMEFEPRSYHAGLIITTVTNYLLVAVLLFYAVTWYLRKRRATGVSGRDKS